MLEWQQIKEIIDQRAKERQLEELYLGRLKTELKEVEKQGANAVWTARYNENFKYGTNKNGLVFPWLLDMTPVDPMTGEHKMEQQTDWPDIDFDCIPEARDGIKEYAALRYGGGKTCSVGTWLTYKFRSAMQDVVRAHGGDMKEVILLTTNLPDDVDELKDGGYAPCVGCKTKHKALQCPKCGSEEVDGTTIAQLIQEHANLAEYNSRHQSIVDMAVRLVGKIKSLGTHAGGLIIADRELFGRIPMALSNGKWTSMWTEGRSPQLSKFGYIKWDVLGLKTLGYINECRKMLLKTRGLVFDILPWARQDKENNILGRYNDRDGNEQLIMMNDQEVFDMINDLRTETVFQFETDVQRGILSNGVRDYYDLQVFNAMGHPGPMESIPDYVKRRDDTSKNWRSEEHPLIADALDDTHGIIVYQEDLQRLWQQFANFTAPEAEAARKAVAKKWKDKLKPVEEQWIRGASKILYPCNGKTSDEWARHYWLEMIDFGRYAFNKSHSCAYVMAAYLTAWLKVHFPPEWWSSVMSACHPDKRVKYMNVARSEGVKFGAINVEDLSINFAVDTATLMVTPGLTSIKGVGEHAVGKIQMQRKYQDIDEFIAINQRNKTVLQRLILLGAFERYHSNIRATWMWYQYKYCTGSEITQLKADIRAQLLADWTPEAIKAEVERQTVLFKQQYPKRKVPAKIINYKPKAKDDRDHVMALFPEDYTPREKRNFEKEYLGYYWHSPMTMYRIVDGATIKAAKNGESVVICVEIESIWRSKTKREKPFGRIAVTDGLNTGTVIIWEDGLEEYGEYLVDRAGVKMYVDYDKDRDTFTISRRNFAISKLETLIEYNKRILEQGYEADEESLLVEH